ncbi:Mitochondrial metalloendopeptidase OMA1 [Carex littledalei]|uniref:Mitochondrial metalloendopeptidase OMA1 n=1 Tax=Carex littledalei TaxID=544730 RepID=A0A833R9H2_9POAL|nr:Mitochondrial metalloendopeptidase OMA1 [Carex littledalei]
MNFFNRARSPLSSLLSRRAKAAASSSLRSLPKTPIPLRSPPIPPSFNYNRAYSFYISRPQTELYQFRRRSGPRWYQDPRKLVIAVVVSGGAIVVIYFGNLETVPYTKRTHLVLLPSSTERKLGESEFKQIKESVKGKILPPLHPDSVRIRLISNQIIKALQHGLKRDELKWSDTEYSSEHVMNEPSSESKDETASQLHSSVKKEVDLNEGFKPEENLDDKWVQESRKAGKGHGNEVATKHLERLNWEVIVVRDGMVNAFCLPGGKIVVFTGLIDNFKTDPEIATVIGHEVGHAIARHSAEMITRNLWFTALQLIVLQFIYMPDLIGALSNFLLHLPFSRRMEIEADHIGIMLLAAAGYDPRIAPKVYEKLGKITGDSTLNNYLSTHPSSKKRAELLSQAQVMDEAMDLYRDAVTGSRTEGFL